MSSFEDLRSKFFEEEPIFQFSCKLTTGNDSRPLQLSPTGSDEFNVDLTYIPVGGPVGYFSGTKFDIAKDTRIKSETNKNVRP